MSDITGLGTILGVWARPGDETFLAAGLTALAREAGNRVACATATRGERGTDDAAGLPPGRLGALREEELAAALDLLGVNEHHWLGLADGSCAGVVPTVGIRAVRRVLDAVRPDTVVTPGTGDPDRRAVSRWTVAAVGTVARDIRLLHAATGRGTEDGPEPVLRLRLEGPVLDRKIAAIRRYATRVDPATGDAALRARWGVECLVAAGAGATVAA
ncbi:MAG TPA: PIG-L family deacetylase [Pseudonocardia sp.]|nr:PIG-L family deacetylase [Pseudonocardia sp.]